MIEGRAAREKDPCWELCWSPTLPSDGNVVGRINNGHFNVPKHLRYSGKIHGVLQGEKFRKDTEASRILLQIDFKRASGGEMITAECSRC